jgi:RNA polymerase sigma-70 factor (ECF subfamily)
VNRASTRLRKERESVMCPHTVQNCQQRAFRLAFRITRNQEDAEDAQQEALLKAHRNLDQFQGRARFTTWISRIAINEALMCLRKRRTVVHVPLEDAFQEDENGCASFELHSNIQDPETAYSQKELRNLLVHAISGLRPLHREVFLLRAVESLSVVETAKALQVSVSTVKTRMRRARRELKDILRATSIPANSQPSAACGPKMPLPIPRSFEETWVI